MTHTHPCPECYSDVPCEDDCSYAHTDIGRRYHHVVCDSCLMRHASEQRGRHAILDELKRELPEMLRLDAQWVDTDKANAHAQVAARHRRLLLRSLEAVPGYVERTREALALCALGLRTAAEYLRRDVDAAERERLAASLDATADRLEARP